MPATPRRDHQQRLRAIAHRHRAPRIEQRREAFGFGVELLREARLLRRQRFRDERFARRHLSVRNTLRYSSICASPDSVERRAQAFRPCLPSVTVPLSSTSAAFASSLRGRCGPSRISRRSPRRVSPARCRAHAESCAIAVATSPARSVHAQKMIAAQRRLPHDVAERHVGRASHRRRQRTARPRCPARRTHRATRAGCARSSISFWSRSSITVKRAGTLASNGNCCSSRVQRRGWSALSARPAFPARRRTTRARACE